MPGNRLALVAADQRLAGALQLYFKKSLGEPLFQCHFDAIRDHLHRDTDGMLLLAVAVPADVEPARRLVQEISLRRLPTCWNWCRTARGAGGGSRGARRKRLKM